MKKCRCGAESSQLICTVVQIAEPCGESEEYAAVIRHETAYEEPVCEECTEEVFHEIMMHEDRTPTKETADAKQD